MKSAPEKSLEKPPSARYSNTTALFKKAASPVVLFYALPWLMVLLVWGTVAQKDLGLYRAHELYFSSWVVWAGFLPLPGTYLTLGLITLSLTAKFLFYSPWRLSRAGTILTHLGVLVLMIGGMLTAATQEEGYLILKEGDESALISDYHDRLITIKRDDEPYLEIPFEDVQSGQVYMADQVSFRILQTCENCQPTPLTDKISDRPRHGLAQKVSLENARVLLEQEANLSGITVDVDGADQEANGIYLAMEEIPHRPEIQSGETTYTLSIGREKRALPFSISLIDFERTFHPGSEMAKSFSSRVDVVEDGGTRRWSHLIRMNEPLRYKGYTFYQSSFSIRPDGEYTILSVVKNSGRIYPYLASALIFAGLLLHLILKAAERRKKEVRSHA